MNDKREGQIRYLLPILFISQQHSKFFRGCNAFEVKTDTFMYNWEYIKVGFFSASELKYPQTEREADPTTLSPKYTSSHLAGAIILRKRGSIRTPTIDVYPILFAVGRGGMSPQAPLPAVRVQANLIEMQQNLFHSRARAPCCHSIRERNAAALKKCGAFKTSKAERAA